MAGASPVRLIAVTIAVALALAPAARGATAPASPAPLPGSTFQGGDGNQDDQAGLVDWQGLQASGRAVHNPDPNAQDTAFAGGSKDEEPGDWRLSTEAGGVEPDKANILDAWSSVDQPAGDTFLYLGFTRRTGTGDTYLAFELNRDSRLWNNGHAEIPCRRTGDLLVAVAAHGNGNGVDVVLERWRTTATDPGTGCATRGEITRVAGVDLNRLQGSVNGGPIVSRLPGFYAPGTTIAGARVFGEMALNLSALVDGAFGTRCLAFGSIWMHSRSSESDNSNLQDYVAPQSLIVRSCAASGEKFFDLNADGVRQPAEPGIPGFFVYADYNDNGVRDPVEPFTQTDVHGRYILDDIRPGAGSSYKLREATLLQLLHRTTGTAWSCSFPHAGTVGGFGDQPGGLLGCGWGPIDPAATPFARDKDFGNWLPAQLTLRKQLFPSDDPGRFDLIVNGVTELPGAGDGATTTITVRPGAYDVSEAAVPPTNAADYHSEVTCRTTVRRRGRVRTGFVYSGLVLRAGDRATCTFYNVRSGAPAIAIEKTGPAVATAGTTLHYRFYVTNPGTIPLSAGTVKVTDSHCDDPPKLTDQAGANGDDATKGTLDPGDTWTYACDHATAAATADCRLSVVTNTATASGSAGGSTVTDDSTIVTTLGCPDVPPEPPLPLPTPNPEPPTPPPNPGPPPQPVAPAGLTPPVAGASGIAGISAHNACVTHVSELRLTGRRMHRISVAVDGRAVTQRTLRLLQRRAAPLSRVLAPGRHRISVHVTFERGSATPAVTLKRTIVVCGRPRVTG